MNGIKFILAFVILALSKITFASWGEPCEKCEYPKDILFTQNNLYINSSTKIDSLFYSILMEINNLPIYGWMGENYEWLEADIKNCMQITLSKSLFYLLSKTEQDSIYSIAQNNVREKRKHLSLTVTDAIIYQPEVNNASVTACSIRANISPNPTGEYILTLNDTPYKMVKLSENHYVLRRER